MGTGLKAMPRLTTSIGPAIWQAKFFRRDEQANEGIEERMSEYQYYEFQAIDRPLTPEEQRAVAQLSSRVDPHPRRAVFTCSFGGGLRRTAEDLLAEYYDAMLYLANWGSRQLMFRFPKTLVDLEQMQQYATEFWSDVVNVIGVDIEGEYAILDIQLGEEEGLDWIEGKGWLDSLVELRDAILRRDYRVLYLAWLKGITLEYREDNDTFEPPVPPGLQALTPALERFVELFDVDEDLIRVAAERSSDLATEINEEDLRRAIAQLSPEERDAFLLRLAKGEPHLSPALNRRLSRFIDTSRSDTFERRTVGELLAAAEALREQRRRERAAAAEAQRIAELNALARREDEAWREVDALIQQSRAKAYDEAMRLLKRLEDLAEYQNRRFTFEDHLGQIRDRYSRRHALMRRLREAGLIHQ
jgi:hypothetical protein